MRIWHCETQEQYDHLMKQLEAEGCTWRSSARPTEKNIWDLFEEDTCVEEEHGVIGVSEMKASSIYLPHIKIQSVIMPTEDKENKKMNKQELIKEIKELNKHNVIHKSFTGIDAGVEIKDVLDLVEQLNEHQKVVLPKDMAKWFDDNVRHYDLQGLLDDLNEEWLSNDRLAMNFIDNHCDNLDDAFCKIARAYIEGYEVEKEKLYTVILPNNTDIPFGYNCYLHRRDDGIVILAIGSFSVREDTKLTEAEIKSLDERYMAFAKEVTE